MCNSILPLITITLCALNKQINAYLLVNIDTNHKLTYTLWCCLHRSKQYLFTHMIGIESRSSVYCSVNLIVEINVIRHIFAKRCSFMSVMLAHIFMPIDYAVRALCEGSCWLVC